MASKFLDDLSDEELVQWVQSGDLAAFNILYLRYQGQVYHRVRAIVGPEDAWDITQETLWKAYRNLSTLQLKSSFKSWIFAVARNAGIDHRRKQGRESPDELEDGDTVQPSPEDCIICIEDLRGAIKRLKTHYREVLGLSIQGYTPKEIAQQLHLSLGSVRTYLSDARRELRQTFPKSHVSNQLDNVDFVQKQNCQAESPTVDACPIQEKRKDPYLGN